MSNVEEAKSLLRIAKRDLHAMRGMAENFDDFADEVFGFHAQQAVEKALKSWLTLKGIRYPRTHDLEKLFELLTSTGTSISNRFSDLVDLVDFAVQYRYDMMDEMSSIDRGAIYSLVSEFISQVDDEISQNRDKQG